MRMRPLGHTLVQAIGITVLLAGCASDYGGRISSDANALSPEERRLQQVETKAAELSRRLDSVNLSGMDQENLRLRDDIRALRGEMERMRFDFDQQNKRAQAQYADIDRRLQRFENPLGVSAAPPPGSVVSPNGTVAQPQYAPQQQQQYAPPQPSGQQLSGLPPQPAPQVQYQGQSQVQQPASGPTVAPSTGNGAPPTVTISQGSGATPEEEGAYLASFDLLKNGKYDDAVKGFKTMLERWPQGRYADNAWYWMGQSQEIKGDYKSAQGSYQSLLQRFPTSPKAPEAMLHLGLAQLKQKHDAEGRATLQRVIQAYPSSNAAKLAQQRLEPPKAGG
jgi:tol-pal system protein YbgF